MAMPPSLAFHKLPEHKTWQEAVWGGASSALQRGAQQAKTVLLGGSPGFDDQCKPHFRKQDRLRTLQAIPSTVGQAFTEHTLSITDRAGVQRHNAAVSAFLKEHGQEQR